MATELDPTVGCITAAATVLEKASSSSAILFSGVPAFARAELAEAEAAAASEELIAITGDDGTRTGNCARLFVEVVEVVSSITISTARSTTSTSLLQPPQSVTSKLRLNFLHNN